MSIHPRQAALFLAALVIVQACGGSSAPAPTAPEPNPPAPAPAPVITDTNTPGCKLNLPKGTGRGVDCPRTTPKHLALVEGAVVTVREMNPSAHPLESAGFRLTAEQL